MTQTVTDELLARWSRVVEERLGLYYPAERWRDLQRVTSKAAKEFGFGDVESCIEWLLAAPLSSDQIDVLSGHLTTGETYFWRDSRAFAALEDYVLPQLIQHRRQSGDRRLRIWSAGCCTGEEAYSIAFLIHRLLPDLAEWNVTILATDINPRFLRKAEQGVVSEWSFRNAPPWLKDRYFKEIAKGRYEIAEHIKSMVQFSRLNLATDNFPSPSNNTEAIDVILCRNVLMYFSNQVRQKIIQNLTSAIVEGGWLCVAAGEASQPLFDPLKTVSFDGAFFYQKISKAVPALPAPSAVQLASMPAPIYATRKASTSVVGRSLPAPMKRRAPEVNKTECEHGTEPASDDSCHRQARALANEGKLEAALECCDRAIAHNRVDATHQYLRATILQELGMVEEAASALKRAIYLDSGFALAHFALGNLARGQSKNREAEKHFQIARQLLEGHASDEILPESAGMTAGQLAALISAMAGRESSVTKRSA